MRALATMALLAFTVTSSACVPRGYRPFSRQIPSGASTICVFGIAGVRSSLVDTDAGVDITLSAVGNATELQRRVHDALADVGPYRLRAASRALANQLQFTIVDQTSGLTIHATPIDRKSNLDAIRSQIHDRFEDATTASCD